MLVLASILICVLSKSKYNDPPCLKVEPNPPRLVGKAPLLKGIKELPEELHWDNVDGINYLTASKNQHIPTYCGACWAFASLTSLADRLKILIKRQFPEVIFSVQNLLSCDMYDDGCHGGFQGNAF